MQWALAIKKTRTTASTICPFSSFALKVSRAELTARTTDVLLLVVFAVLFFMAAFVSFLRTDIT